MAIKPKRYYYCLKGDNVDIGIFKLLLNASRKPAIKTLYFDNSYLKREESRCCFKDFNSNRLKNKKKNLSILDTQAAPSDLITTNEYLKILARQCSLPNVLSGDHHDRLKRRRSDSHLNTSTPCRTKFIIRNLLLEPTILLPNCLNIQNMLRHPLTQAKLRIYHFQIGKQDRCYSCGSDAIFEVINFMHEDHHKKVNKKQTLIPQKTAITTKTVGNIKPKYDLLSPHAKGMLKKRETPYKGLVTLVVPPQHRKTNSPHAINKFEECLYFPLEQKTGDYKVNYPYNINLPQLVDDTISDLKMNNEAIKAIPTLVAKQIAPLENSTVRVETVNVFVEKDLSNAVKNEQEAKTINFTQKTQTQRKEKTVVQNISLPKGNIMKVRKDIGQSVELAKGTDHAKNPVSEVTRYDTAIEKRTSLGKRSKSRAGLWTPLEGKKPKQKEKLLRGLMKHGISIPEGKTESVKNLISKVRKNMGFPPSPKNKEDKEKFATAQALGLITPLLGKSKTQKERILRALAKRSIPLPEGRTDSEKALIIKIGKEVKTKNSCDNFHKNKAVSPLTRLQRKPSKRGILSPKKKLATASKISFSKENKKEVKFLVYPTVGIGKENKTDAQLGDLVKPLKSKDKYIRQKEKLSKRPNNINKVLPQDRTKLEKALIDTVKNGVKSSITSSKVSSEAYEMSPYKKMAPLIEIYQKNNDGLQPDPYVLIDFKEKNNKPKIDGPLSLLDGLSMLQKETLLTALAENGVVLPDATLLPEKSFNNIDKIETMPLDQPIMPTIARKQCDDIKNNVTEENNKGKETLLTLVNNMIIKPEQKPLTGHKTITTHMAAKVNKDTLKERSTTLPVIGDSLPDGKTDSSNKKIENKASVRTSSGVVRLGKPLEKNLNSKNNQCTASTYTGSLRLEATRLSTPHVGEEFMTSSQKSIFQVLSTYLANIEIY